MKMPLIQKIAYYLITIVFGAIVMREGAFILVPLVWGVFFAFALNPIALWMEKRRIPRGLAIVMSILFVTAIVLGVFYSLFNQMIGLVKDIPEIGDNLQRKMSHYLEDVGAMVGGDFSNSIQGEQLLKYLTPEGLNNTLFSTGKSLTLAGIIPLYIFLLMYYKDFFATFLVRFSSENKEKVLAWVMDSGKIIQYYLSGMVRVTLIVAILAGIYFYLIGLKYFVLFAAFIAIMNLIPYVGVFLSSLFAILYVFLTTDSLVYPVMTFAVLWGIQLLENNIITPWVVGSQVKVNALAVILAILLGGYLWGVSGMILFIPLVGVLKITLERIEGLEAFGFLLSDEVPQEEKSGKIKTGFWKSLFGKKSEDRE